MLVDRKYHVGVDLGQRQNHSAIVVVEQQVEYVGKRDRATYEYLCERRVVVTLAERVPLQTSYSTIEDAVRSLTGTLAAGALGKGASRVVTAVDATGLGRLVSDDLRQRGLPGEAMPVVITGGQRGREQDGEWSVPRQELLMGVVQTMDAGLLDVAAGMKGWWQLREELEQMERVLRNGEARIETKGQDDLVFALGLSLFSVGKRPLRTDGLALRRKVERMERLFGGR